MYRYLELHLPETDMVQLPEGALGVAADRTVIQHPERGPIMLLRVTALVPHEPLG